MIGCLEMKIIMIGYLEMKIILSFVDEDTEVVPVHNFRTSPQQPMVQNLSPKKTQVSITKSFLYQRKVNCTNGRRHPDVFLPLHPAAPHVRPPCTWDPTPPRVPRGRFRCAVGLPLDHRNSDVYQPSTNLRKRGRMSIRRW